MQKRLNKQNKCRNNTASMQVLKKQKILVKFEIIQLFESYYLPTKTKVHQLYIRRQRQ